MTRSKNQERRVHGVAVDSKGDWTSRTACQAFGSYGPDAPAVAYNPAAVTCRACLAKMDRVAKVQL